MAEAHEFDQQIREAFGTQFALERELPGGGMSRVYLATERALNRKVVIKVLPPELAAGVNRERFRREIQLAAQAAKLRFPTKEVCEASYRMGEEFLTDQGFSRAWGYAALQHF